MLQTLNCIRMGEVLLDENLQIFILCNNCHTDLRNLHDFRQHLEKCEGLENIFKDGQQLKYNTDKSTQLFGKTFKGIKEFLVYDYCDVEMSYIKPEDNFIDLINIEEELLNPKWYSDLNTEVVSTNTSNQKSAKQYDELVEAVTPFVQFKENVKANNNGSRKNSFTNTTCTDTQITTKLPDKSIKTANVAANKTKLPIKRKLVPKSVPIQLEPPKTQGNIATITASLDNAPTTVQVNKTYTAKKRKTNAEQTIFNGTAKPIEIVHQIPLLTAPIAKPKVNNKSTTTPTQATNDLNSMTQTSTVIPASIVNAGPTKEKQTAQILNKLQNLGLQVKRTQTLPPPPTVPNAAATTSKTDTKTMEILQKLQSKGMKVKILNKQQTTTTMAKPLPSAVDSNSLNKTIPSVIRNPAANMAIKQNLNKNLIIRKVN